MAQIQHTPVLQEHKEIRWNNYNYPPLIKIMHFIPSQLPSQKKFIVISLFIIHLVILGNTFLNFISSCTQGGLRVLYSFLFMLFFNPFILLVFYRGFTGICKDSSKLRLYIILQPIAIILELVASIGNFLGFNGFVRATDLFSMQKGFAGILAIVVSVIFLSVGLYSIFIYIRLLREKKDLVANLS